MNTLMVVQLRSCLVQFTELHRRLGSTCFLVGSVEISAIHFGALFLVLIKKKHQKRPFGKHGDSDAAVVLSQFLID
jgi:hypothetical protein